MREIKGLNYLAYCALCEDLTDKFAETVIPSEFDLADVTLNDNVIVKAYNDRLTLDLGAKKSSLERDDFKSFTFI